LRSAMTDVPGSNIRITLRRVRLRMLMRNEDLRDY